MSGHFDGTGSNCLIHTTRSPGPCNAVGAGGGCNYRENCPELGYDPWNAHHILPVHSVNAYPTDPDLKGYVRQVDDTYKLTKWCINQKPNMIALPLKSTHRAHEEVRDMKLPAHDVDHNCTDGYTEEVLEDIKEMIWAKVKKAAAKKGKDHFEPKQVKSQFEKLVGKFRRNIHTRGGRSGGTATAYKKMGSTKNRWWLAFSMAKTSVAMSRPLATL